MVELRATGSIFEVGAEAIVNPVNCVGVMGAGLALEFKKRYPAMNAEYVKVCKKGKLQVGKIWVWHECSDGCCSTAPCGCRSYRPCPEHLPLASWLKDRGFDFIHTFPSAHYIVNFPTKDHWKNPSQLQWIADGLDDLKNHATIKDVVSIAMPALGCGFGGLHFEDVLALVEHKFGDLSMKVMLFGPR